ALISDPARAHLVAFIATGRGKELAPRRGIPIYAADPKFFAVGSKSGCRRLFGGLGVPHPGGREGLGSMEEAAAALAALHAARPNIRQAIVTLNAGVSGQGTALVDLADLPAPGREGELEEIRVRLRHMEMPAPDLSFD